MFVVSSCHRLTIKSVPPHLKMSRAALYALLGILIDIVDLTRRNMSADAIHTSTTAFLKCSSFAKNTSRIVDR